MVHSRSPYLSVKPGVWRLRSPALLLLGLGLLTGALSADTPKPAHRFSLQDARSYALNHNYDVRKSRIDVESSRKKLRETVAAGLPQVSSNLSYMNNLELTTMLIPNFFEGKFDEKIAVQFGTQHNATLTLQVEQLVFNGSYIVGLKTSRIFRRLADEGLERTALDIQETVTSTYYTILVTEESERILRSSLENLEKTHHEIRERYKEGFVAETDADLVQISVTALRNTLQNLGRQKVIAYNLLKFQMGLSLEEEVALSENLEEILAEVDVREAIDRAFELERNIDYRLLDTQERLAELALKNEKSKYWPTVAAFYTYQRSAMRDSFNFFNFDKNWYRAQIFGVNISVPIFKSGAQRAKVQQAALTLEQARTTREQASQGLLLEASRAKTTLVSAYENYINIKANLALAEKVYNVTLIKYKEGVASSMDLTQAHDKFLAAQSSYIQSISDLLNAKNTLDRMTDTYQSVRTIS